MKNTLSLLTLVILASGCVDRQAQNQAKRTQDIVMNPTRPVTVQPVRMESLAETMEVSGEVTTSQDSRIGAKRGGRLVSVFVRDGDPVSAGQLIASLDASDMQAQLQQALAGVSSARAQLSQAATNAAVGPARSEAAVKQAEAQVRAAKAQYAKARAGARKEERVQVEWQVKQAETNLKTAEKELERTRTLVEQGALPKARLDSAQNAYMAALTQYNAALQSQAIVTTGTRAEDLAVAEEGVRQAEEALRSAKAQQRLDALLQDQVEAARAAVQSANAQVAIARQALADAQIRAPFAGRVSGRPPQPGTILAPGDQIVRLIGGQGLYFEAEVPEVAVSRVRPGSPVEVRIDALPGRTLFGSVAAVGPVGESVGRLFRIRVTISGNLESVKPGMFASGNVVVRRVPSATVVPVTAVVQRGGKSVVFVVKDNKAKAVEIETGLRQAGLMQVSGVTVGEQVVIQGQDGLIEGSPVQIAPRASMTAAAASESGA